MARKRRRGSAPEAPPKASKRKAQEAEDEGEESEEDVKEETGSSASESSSGSDCSEPEASESEEESDDDEDGEAFEEVRCEFEFFDPAERDFHGLKVLLAMYLDGEGWNSSEVVDTIIAQSTVGTVVKAGKDEDPLALISALNLQRYRSLKSLCEVKNHLLERCTEEKHRKQLRKAWEADGTGLIINERMRNCPPELGPPLLQALDSEIEWATEDEPTQELRDSFKFKRFIYCARVFRDAGGGAPGTGAGAAVTPGGSGTAKGNGKRKKGKGKAKADPVEEAVEDDGMGFLKPDDEFIMTAADWHFMYPLATDEKGPEGALRPHRLVCGFDAAKFKEARAALDAVVGNMGANAE